MATERPPKAGSVGTASPEPASPPGCKLTGREFYESIGSPKMILAPMVDQSEFAWRMLTRSFLTDTSSDTLLAYTPMLHARQFKETRKFRDHHFQPTRTGLADCPPPDHAPPEAEVFLDGRKDVDRPLTVQFCANDPDELVEAARYVQPYCDAVDLNLGCPQGIARKGNYGAFLQDDWGLVAGLINKLHVELHVPVTAKMRILDTKERTLEYAKTIVGAGASIITVHGRQRDQKGHKTGLADWAVIRYLRENLPPDTVLFANGNILRHEDIAICIAETGADGVMSAEANLHDPTVFATPPSDPEDRTYWRSRSGKGGYRMDAVFRRYLSVLYKYVLETPEPERPPLFLPSDLQTAQTWEEKEDSPQPPSKKQKRTTMRPSSSPNLIAMQPHLFRLLRPLVSVHTDVRDALAKSRAGDIAAFENVLTLTEKAIRQGLLDYEANPEKYDVHEEPNDRVASEADEINDHESSLRAVRACKRPWWVCQPYVRPLPKEALEKGSLTLSKKDKRKMEEEAMTNKLEEGGSRVEAKTSQREENDAKDGLDKAQIPAQAMVCG